MSETREVKQEKQVSVVMKIEGIPTADDVAEFEETWRARLSERVDVGDTVVTLKAVIKTGI